jgi:NAD(P)H-hydrate epimerase
VISFGSGIGMNEETINGIISIIKKYKNKIKVIDADAIFAIGNYGYKNLDLTNSVLTPHIREFSKLINVELNELNKNILFYGEEFVKEKNCYLVLKGPRTIIFTKEQEIFINSVGNEGLAKFGTGDVLTGVIAGFLSQTKSFEDSLMSGVYLHSFAADLLKEEKTEFGYTSTDLLEKLPFAIKFIKNSIV